MAGDHKDRVENLLKDLGVDDVALKAIIALTTSMDINNRALTQIVENTESMNKFFNDKNGMIKMVKEVVAEEQRYLLVKISLAVVGLSSVISSIFMFLNNSKIDTLTDFIKENIIPHLGK